MVVFFGFFVKDLAEKNKNSRELVISNENLKYPSFIKKQVLEAFEKASELWNEELFPFNVEIKLEQEKIPCKVLKLEKRR
jgi:hypothetical protein